ncbi:MAG TPA: VWA domain-containing protein, partial [Pyrinomonadaceae bacterium]|nr:VWA domain-containing protein [Pyrinomonadaceae bacterium]
ASVWKENYVAIATSVEGDRTLSQSPVVIDNRKQLLSISIVRRPTEPAVVIRLKIKIPATAHAELITGKYPVALFGTPASASIKSTSGGISIEFAEGPNADIFARSITGEVSAVLPELRSSSGHVIQARAGSGSQTLRANSQSGAITLSMAKRADRLTAQENADGPGLEEARKPAGTPAPALDTQEVSEGDVIRVDSQLVTLNMSVVDRNTSRGLMGLTKSDFRLFENNNEQDILQFESSAAPFDLMLLIDLSGSTRDVVSLIKAAALRFVNAARPFDRIGVITFAGQPTVISPLTLNRQLLRDRINAIDTIAGDTKLYDASDFALTQLLQDTKNARRTAVVLMSDGLDGNIPGVQGDGSRLAYADLLNRVREFDGVLYTLWLNTEYESLSPLDTQPEAFDAGHDRMQEMADAGGGVFYEVERLDDLAGAYERVVADLGTVYSLAYRPSDKVRDGKWRAIRVAVNRPNAVARGKRGYYAN